VKLISFIKLVFGIVIVYGLLHPDATFLTPEFFIVLPVYEMIVFVLLSDFIKGVSSIKGGSPYVGLNAMTPNGGRIQPSNVPKMRIRYGRDGTNNENRKAREKFVGWVEFNETQQWGNWGQTLICDFC
jgi:hypothetical protein